MARKRFWWFAPSGIAGIATVSSQRKHPSLLSGAQRRLNTVARSCHWSAIGPSDNGDASALNSRARIAGRAEGRDQSQGLSKAREGRRHRHRTWRFQERRRRPWPCASNRAPMACNTRSGQPRDEEDDTVTTAPSAIAAAAWAGLTTLVMQRFRSSECGAGRCGRPRVRQGRSPEI